MEQAPLVAVQPPPSPGPAGAAAIVNVVTLSSGVSSSTPSALAVIVMCVSAVPSCATNDMSMLAPGASS